LREVFFEGGVGRRKRVTINHESGRRVEKTIQGGKLDARASKGAAAGGMFWLWSKQKFPADTISFAKVCI
jgi:hypothetical protein